MCSSDLSLLHDQALIALEGSISELTLVAAGFVTSARLFTGALRTEYRSGQALRLGTASRYVDPATGEITEGAVILPDPGVTAKAAASSGLASGGTSSGTSASARALGMVSALASATPTGLVFASDAFISLADPLPKAAGGVTVTASEAVFVVNPALLEGVQVSTQRFLVTPAASLDAGNEEQTLSDLTDTEAELPPITTPLGVLPGGFVVTPDTDSALVFGGTAGKGGAFGVGEDSLTLTFTVPVGSGVLRASATATGSPLPVAVTGSGTRTLTLAGTEAALSAYLADATGAVRYNGLANQTLTLTAARPATAKLGVMSSQATIGLYGASRSVSVVPVIASLPARLWVTANTASQVQFPGAVLGGAGTLRVTLALPQSLALGTGQGLSATPQSGDGITVLAGATARALTAVSLVILAAWLLNVGTRRRLPNVGATVRRSG